MPLDMQAWLRPKPKPKAPHLGKDEQIARQRIISEAKAKGATLHDQEQRGGIRPSLALGVFRRDGFRCARCHGADDLGLHHRGHLDNPPTKWLAEMGKKDTLQNLATTCEKCHDSVHDEDREATP